MPSGSMTDEPTGILGWQVTVQDWRGYPVGSRRKQPKVSTKWFPSRSEALIEKARLRELNPSTDFLVCITPAPGTRTKRKVRR